MKNVRKLFAVTLSFLLCCSLPWAAFAEGADHLQTDEEAFQIRTTAEDSESPAVKTELDEIEGDQLSVPTAESMDQVSAPAKARGNVVDSGPYGDMGDNISWVLYDNGVLSITGTGVISDWDYDEMVTPWEPYTSQIYSVEISPGVTGIGEGAFSGCVNLHSVSIPEGITSIGNYAFFWCKSLTNVTIPDSVVSIGAYAFQHCEALTGVSIPDGIVRIPLYAFANCVELESVAIPDSVTAIEQYAFADCGKLTDVTIPDGVTGIGSCAFARCTSLKDMMIPDSVTSLGTSVFTGCSNLTDVRLPRRLSHIGNGTFSKCTGLSSVRIPAAVTSIDGYAFYGCSSLMSIRFEGDAPDIGEHAFESVSACAWYPTDKNWPADTRSNYGGTLTWMPYTPLLLTKQPTDQRVREGSEAVFTVEASGEELHFQWYQKADDDPDWSPIEGATEEEYRLTAAVNNDGLQFCCRVSGSDDSVFSEAAAIHVETGFTLSGTLLANNEEADSLVLLYPGGQDPDQIMKAWLHNSLDEALFTVSSVSSSFSFERLPEGDYCLVVVKPNKYVPYIGEIQVESDTELEEIKLQIYGDIDRNGLVNALDVLYLQLYIGSYAGPMSKLSEEELMHVKQAADVNFDGDATAMDSLYLQLYIGSQTGPLSKIP